MSIFDIFKKDKVLHSFTEKQEDFIDSLLWEIRGIAEDNKHNEPEDVIENFVEEIDDYEIAFYSKSRDVEDAASTIDYLIELKGKLKE